MLSRTAEGLFWMARYVERMSNTARLLDAGRRLDALPRRAGAPDSEWTSIVIASGCSDSFPGDPKTADVASVCEHLVRDETNPSSIVSCVYAARRNAKAVRPAITSDVWEAINQTYVELNQNLEAELDRKNLSAFLDWVRGRAALIYGARGETMFRDDGHSFAELGKWIERADATARLLDVKYHVLLPDVADVGGGLDYLQWTQILRAANSATAFRHVYGRSVDANGVVDFLVLNRECPRSLRTAVNHLYGELQTLVSKHDAPQNDLLQRVRADYAQLMELTLEEIFEEGLHEWLTRFIIKINIIASTTADVFGFGAQPAVQKMQVAQ